MGLPDRPAEAFMGVTMTTPAAIVLTISAFAGGGIAGAFIALRQPLTDAVAKGYALSLTVHLGPPSAPKPAVQKTDEQHGVMNHRPDPVIPRFPSKMARDTGEAA